MSWTDLKKWIDGERELFDVPAASPKASKTEEKKSSAPRDGGRAIRVVSVISALVILAVMLSVVFTLPEFGTGAATDNELTQRYVEQGMYEVGAKNLVVNMILVYRGFDTFGESTVLFTAAVCVILLLMGTSTGRPEPLCEPNTTILQNVVRRLFPFVLVFGVYILLNGHLSPGGGFSGGAVLGAGMILLDISLGAGTVGKFFRYKVFNIVRAFALVFYCAAISWLVVCGANGLNSHIGTGIPGHLFSAGLILPINVMVGCVVGCTMYAFYTYFYRGELK